MTILIITLFCIVAILLTMQFYYRMKYITYSELVNAANNEYEVLKSKSINKIVNERKKIRKELNTKFNNELEKIRKEMEADYNEACESVKNELFEKLQEVDNIIGQHAQKDALKNIPSA